MDEVTEDRLKLVSLAEAFGWLDKPRRKRKCSVHPYNKNRETSRRFLNFFEDLKTHGDKFFNYYRMTNASFHELLEKVRSQISKHHTRWKNPITAEERLSITLRYLATGNSYASLSLEYFVGKTTVASIVTETCQAIWDSLKSTEMPEPTEEQWIEIANNFENKTDFPNCVGAVDGKHIRCIKPQQSGSKLFNYKKYFSIVLMAVADANLKFTAIDIGAYGEEGNSTVFRDSALGKKLFSGQLNLPPPRCLPNTNSDPQPFVMVGDEAFRLHTNLLRPFPQRNLDARRRVFNYRLSRCRRSVECAFGVLANKWRVLHTAIMLTPDNVDIIVKACCVLHNFVQNRDGVNYEDGETHPFEDEVNFGRNPQHQGNEVREYFADYFMGPGAVPFQES